MKAHRWNGLALGIIVICAATSAGRVDEPWPTLLSSEPASMDRSVAVLQLRANLALDRLIQSARDTAEPL